LAKKYGADAVRYDLLREAPYGQDLDFTEANLINRYNTELADDLGNLVSRVLTLIEKFSDGKVPKAGRQKEEDVGLIAQSDGVIRHATELISDLEFHRALEKIFAYAKLANKYVADEKPWELAKSEDKKTKEHLSTVLYNLAESLRIISALVWPFMPETA
jgi:methionyl-tRNA synthetase